MTCSYRSHPCDLQEGLARALEFEAFLPTIGGVPGPSELRYSGEVTALPRHFQARRVQVPDKARGRKASPEEFRGDCWGCGQRGPVWQQVEDLFVGGALSNGFQVLLLELWPV